MNMTRSGLDELAVFLQFLTCRRIEAMLPSVEDTCYCRAVAPFERDASLQPLVTHCKKNDVKGFYDKASSVSQLQYVLSLLFIVNREGNVHAPSLLV